MHPRTQKHPKGPQETIQTLPTGAPRRSPHPPNRLQYCTVLPYDGRQEGPKRLARVLITPPSGSCHQGWHVTLVMLRVPLPPVSYRSHSVCSFSLYSDTSGPAIPLKTSPCCKWSCQTSRAPTDAPSHDLPIKAPPSHWLGPQPEEPPNRWGRRLRPHEAAE